MLGRWFSHKELSIMYGNGSKGFQFSGVPTPKSHTSILRDLFINTLRQRQNGYLFADNTFKRIFLNENVWISITISLKFVPKGPINNIPALFQIMVYRRPGDNPLSEPVLVGSLTHICVTRPQWVNTIDLKIRHGYTITPQSFAHDMIYHPSPNNGGLAKPLREGYFIASHKRGFATRKTRACTCDIIFWCTVSLHVTFAHAFRFRFTSRREHWETRTSIPANDTTTVHNDILVHGKTIGNN